jgi:DNA (cytosine-5)-methyltransferase 1
LHIIYNLKMSDNLTYIDLFAGAGGLSEGFIKEGYFPVAHVEKDRNACDTLKTRTAYHYLKDDYSLPVYQDYIIKQLDRNKLYQEVPQALINTIINKEITNDTVESIFEIINHNLKTFNKSNIDLILGGPPCQAYSIIGRARVRDEEKKQNDPRLFLFRLYIKFLKEYKPKIFVFENVPGILNAKDIDKRLFIDKIKEEFDASGYIIDYKILNASDYGVLQNRNRVFIIGWQRELNFSYPIFDKKLPTNPNINHDILSDLPSLQSGQQWNNYNYNTPCTNYLREFGIRNENDLLTWHVARPTNENDTEIYKLAIAKWFDENKRLLYPELPQRLRTQKNHDSFLNRFSVVEGNKPFSHTVVAHIAQDGHYYIHPDINQLRSITVREAARLQSFPDNFFFEGSRTSAFTQIGNAVPPLVAQAIAQKIKQML